MKINYIKVYPRKQATQYSVAINGCIEGERLVPILSDDKLILRREPLIGDRRSLKVNKASLNMSTFILAGVESGSLDSLAGERLYPCEYESNEDEIVFWI